MTDQTAGAAAAGADIFARKGEATTAGFAVVTGPRHAGWVSPPRERAGRRHGLLLTAVVALALSPVAVWATFSTIDRMRDVPLIRLVTPTAEVALPETVSAKPKTVAAAHYWVQFHAFASAAKARHEAARLGTTHSDLFNGLRVKVAESGRPGRIFFGLQAGSFGSLAAARALCDRAQKRKLTCMVLRPVVK